MRAAPGPMPWAPARLVSRVGAGRGRVAGRRPAARFTLAGPGRVPRVARRRTVPPLSRFLLAGRGGQRARRLLSGGWGGGRLWTFTWRRSTRRRRWRRATRRTWMRSWSSTRCAPPTPPPLVCLPDAPIYALRSRCPAHGYREEEGGGGGGAEIWREMAEAGTERTESEGDRSTWGFGEHICLGPSRLIQSSKAAHIRCPPPASLPLRERGLRETKWGWGRGCERRRWQGDREGEGAAEGGEGLAKAEAGENWPAGAGESESERAGRRE